MTLRQRLRPWTVGIMVGTLVIWLAWDVVLSRLGGHTESQILTGWARWSVALPWFCGMILGHWFWPWRGTWASGHSRVLVACNFAVLAGLIGWDVWNPPAIRFLRLPEVWALHGVLCGHFLWGQRSGGPEPRVES